MRRSVRVAAACGIASPAVAGAAIAAAIVRAPSFSAATDALSDLGVTHGAAPLFNGGLLVAGALAVGFAGALWAVAASPLQRAGAAVAGVAGAGLAGVGAFPEGQALHAPAALTFYAGYTYALFCWGSGDVRTGATRRGLATMWLGIAHVTAWLAWGVALVPAGVDGLAIPETVGAALIAAWTVTTARRVRRRSP